MLIIKNLTRSKIDKKFLQSVAEKSLKNLPKLTKKTKKIEIELVVIGEKRMKSLNRAWRGKNKATDVLSFGSQKLKTSAFGGSAEGGKNQKFKFVTLPDDIVRLGQIFICFPIAIKQAKKYGFSVKEEAARLLIHGILHLAGYDHEKNRKDEKKMMDLQEKIFDKIKKHA